MYPKSGTNICDLNWKKRRFVLIHSLRKYKNVFFTNKNRKRFVTIYNSPIQNSPEKSCNEGKNSSIRNSLV